MKETWEQSIWLAKKINEAGTKIDAVFAALTNIQLVVNGIGEQLVGTKITVTDGTNTFQGTFSETLKLAFQLESLGTYTVTYVKNVDDAGSIEYGTVEVVIEDYGYYTVDCEYFPGYDLWEYWCELGGLNASDYANFDALLADSTDVTILMNTTAAVDYLILSKEVLMPTILASTTATQAMIRSSYALGKLKADTDWRTAFVNSSTAKIAAKSCSDILKSITVTAPEIKWRNDDPYTSQTTSGTGTIENYAELKPIAIYQTVYGSLGGNLSISGKCYVNGVVTITAPSVEASTTSGAGYVTVADVVESVGVSITGTNYNGYTTLNGNTVLYYI